MFCKSVGHDETNCRAYDMMTDRRAYRMQGDEQEGQGMPQYNAPRGGYQNKGGYGGHGRG